MPSTLIGGQSGGVQLVSGNPWSGQMTAPTGLRLRVTSNSSGSAFIAYSGGITIFSGGALASGGMSDGLEMRVTDPWYTMQLPVGGAQNIYATATAANSGQVRINWGVMGGGFPG